MKPITKAEVEEVMEITTPDKIGLHALVAMETTEDRQFAQLIFIPDPTRLAWLMIGYEIARARAEKEVLEDWYIKNLESDIDCFALGIAQLIDEVGKIDNKLLVEKLNELSNMKWKKHWKHLGEI